MKRSQGVRVIAYVRAAPDEALADPVGWFGRTPELQQNAVRAWADGQHARVVDTLLDRCSAGVEAVSDRVAFAMGLARVRDGHADVICVASLDDLSGDVLVQEMLLAEARGSGVTLASARPEDETELRDEPSDPARALIRRVLVLAPQFQGEMRSMRARLRREQTLAELESAHATLVRIEAMEEHGATPRDILSMVDADTRRTRRHRVLAMIRGRAS